jgi:hypothetical protein
LQIANLLLLTPNEKEVKPGVEQQQKQTEAPEKLAFSGGRQKTLQIHLNFP